MQPFRIFIKYAKVRKNTLLIHAPSLVCLPANKAGFVAVFEFFESL